MDWLTEIVEDLVPRIDIDNADSERQDRRICFARWDGPLRVGLTGSRDGIQRLLRPFTAMMEGEEVSECLLVLDTIEGKAWINVCGCRQSPIRKIKMVHVVAYAGGWH